MKKIIILLLIFIVSAVGISLYLYFKPSKDLAKVKPDIIISAKKFIEDYASDEASGNEKYVGKIIAVQGLIYSIQSTEQGISTIFLEDDFFGISCVLDSAYSVSVKDILDSSVKGSPINIKGRCNGILTNIQMSSCVLAESAVE